MMWRAVWLSAVIGAVCFMNTARGAVRYEVVDLGGLGDSSFAAAINDVGDVVVDYRVEGEIRTAGAAVWRGGQFIDLVSPNRESIQAFDINNTEQVVGSFGVNPVPSGAFIWDAVGGVRRFDLPGITVTQATGISEAGEIIGTAITPTGQIPLLVRDGEVLDLRGGLPIEHAVAASINDAGQLVFFGNQDELYLWDNGDVTRLEQDIAIESDIPDAGGDRLHLRPPNPTRILIVSDINNAGWLVGMAWRDGAPNPFLKNDDGFIFPGGFRVGQALSVNDAGQVVGWVYTNSMDSGFLWDQGETFFLDDLIPSDFGGHIVRANDINERGEIAVTAILDGKRRAVLLRPVPEPASAWLFGGLGLLRRRRLRATAHRPGRIGQSGSVPENDQSVHDAVVGFFRGPGCLDLHPQIVTPRCEL